MYREVDDCAGCNIREVHISAPVVRLQRRHSLDLRTYPKRADKWFIGQGDPAVELDPILRHLHLLDTFRQWLIQQAVCVVPTSPPNSGMRAVVPTGCGPLGLIECGSQLAEIIFRSDRVSTRSKLLDHILYGPNDLLSANRPGAEGVGVGHTPSYWFV